MSNRVSFLAAAAILGAAVAPAPAAAEQPIASMPTITVSVEVGAQETYPFSMLDVGRRALRIFGTKSIRVRKLIWGFFSDDLLVTIRHPREARFVGARCDLDHDEDKETVRISSCRYLDKGLWVSVPGDVKYGYGAMVPAAAVSADRREITPAERYTRMKDRQFHEAMGWSLGI